MPSAAALLGLGGNHKVLEHRLSSWASASAARTLLDLYSRCTEWDPARRLQSVGEIISSLSSADLALRNRMEAFSAEEFFEELLFSVIGFWVPGQDIGGKYTSRSGRSEITIWDKTILERFVNFTVTVRRLGKTLISGSSDVGDVRRHLKRRIDNVISSYGHQFIVRRGSGNDPSQMALRLQNVPLTPAGVAKAAAALTDALAAFETVG
jgi:hypothetical protein